MRKLQAITTKHTNKTFLIFITNPPLNSLK
jgi:hypothetical protein